MSRPTSHPSDEGKRGLQPLSALVGKALDPVTAKRGFAAADLIAAWPAVVGERYARVTRPEKLAWPRKAGDKPAAEGGTLTIAVDGSAAVYLQHDLGVVAEAVNRFLGFHAVERVKLVQRPVAPPPAPKPPQALPPDPATEAALAASLAGIEDEGLRESLRDLGRAVLTRPLRSS